MSYAYKTSHGPWCEEPYKGECLLFSTDGTRLGADIAHQFSITSEREIIETEMIGTAADNAKRLDGMDAEQAEWDSEDGTAWQ
jgi:hypothetical protein